MIEETISHLKTALMDSDNLVPKKTDFRKLVVKYKCTAPPSEEFTCTHYSPSISGFCTFQMFMTESGSDTYCLKENGEC